MKRKALGRGLGALIPTVATAGAAREGFVWVDVGQILANPCQPREQFYDEGLDELARSIQSHGVLQPVVVRRSGTGYQLIAGERRWRAAQRAGLTRLPAIVREATEDRVLEMALVENVQRQDLNPIEEARAFSSLVGELALTQEEVSKRVGKPRASIANSLRLLKLPEEVQDLVRGGGLSAGHAKVLSGLDNAQEQIEIAREAHRRGMSVRDLERLLSRRGRAPAQQSRKGPLRTDPNTVKAEEDLQRALGTKVQIERRGKGGSVVIQFYSEEELQRLYSMLTEAPLSTRAYQKGGRG